MTVKLTTSGHRTEKRAPEGGWGYLIAIGLMIPCSFSVGGMHSFGLIFNGFLASLGAETSAVTIIMGIFFSSQSFSALFVNSLIRKYSMRSVGTFGAIIYTVGQLLTVFVTSVEMLMITFGMQGIGLGFMVPIGYTNFNQYFVEKRVFMMSVTQAMKGIVITSHPILANFLMDMFGFRGTLAIMAALNAHVIFGMLAMHPIDWHCKIVEIPDVELKPLINELNNENVKDNENINESIRNVVTEIDEPHEININLMLDDEHVNNGKSIDTQKQHMVMNQFTWSGISRDKILRKIERSKSLSEPTQFIEFDPLRTRIASIMSLSDFGGDIIPMKSFDESHKIGFWKKVVEFLDLNLMKDMIYVNIILGISFTTFADNTFIPLLPIYLDTLGFTKNQAARIVSVGAGVDLVSRITLAFLSMCIQPKARYVFMVGSVSTIIIRCVILTMFDSFGMMIAVGVMGFFRTMIHVPIALIFAEHLPSERFAAGYGLFMFLQGNFAFIIGPIFGWIRDITQSYVLFFHLLSITTALCVIPWFIEIIWFKILSEK